jgi:hypothetical protein
MNRREKEDNERVKQQPQRPRDNEGNGERKEEEDVEENICGLPKRLKMS